MPALKNAALEKLVGHAVVTRVHEDAKAGLVLFVDAANTAHLAEGKALASGVELTTTRRDSLHYTSPLFAVLELAAWLDDTKRVDARDMAWSATGQSYREALRFGPRVLVVWGGNNARTLQTIGLTFDDASRAQRFAESFTTVPKWVRTGPWYVPGRGGVAREYWPAKVPGKKVVKALGRVIDETARWVIDRGDAPETTRDETFKTNAEAMAAFTQWELDWYLAGGRPYEIEWMERLRSRAESTLLQHADAQLEQQADKGAFLRALVTDAGLAVPPKGTQLSDVDEAHWLRVGERAAKKVERLEAKKKPGVSIHFDREHLVVAVITRKEGRRTWSVVKRASDEKKADALWLRTRRRFGLP
jgi:hypothetical protein